MDTNLDNITGDEHRENNKFKSKSNKILQRNNEFNSPPENLDSIDNIRAHSLNSNRNIEQEDSLGYNHNNSTSISNHNSLKIDFQFDKKEKEENVEKRKASYCSNHSNPKGYCHNQAQGVRNCKAFLYLINFRQIFFYYRNKLYNT